MLKYRWMMNYIEIWDQPQNRERCIHSQVVKSRRNEISCLPFPFQPMFYLWNVPLTASNFWDVSASLAKSVLSSRFPHLSTAWNLEEEADKAILFQCIIIWFFSNQNNLKDSYEFIWKGFATSHVVIVFTNQQSRGCEFKKSTPVLSRSDD